MTAAGQVYPNGATRGRALSIILHSDTKVGKSTFLNTANAPRLLIDAEAAYRFLPGNKKFWDPVKEGAPPLYDGTWETCVVVVREYQDLMTAVQWLHSGQHTFRSVLMDSITEIQVKCKLNLTSGNYDMDQRKWGALLDHMADLCRTMRDLTEHPTMPIEVVGLSAMTEFRNNKWRPYVQGKLSVTMPYFMDIIGYMSVVDIPNADPTQPPMKERQLLTGPDNMIEAGERVQGKIPARMMVPPNYPTIPALLQMVFGPEGSNVAAE